MANHSNGIETRVEVMLEANEGGVLGASKRISFCEMILVSVTLPRFHFSYNFLNLFI